MQEESKTNLKEVSSTFTFRKAMLISLYNSKMAPKLTPQSRRLASSARITERGEKDGRLLRANSGPQSS